jgi:hypothetical protein
MTYDVLVVGASGGAFSGGGGAGEVSYVQNFTIVAGFFLIQCGIDRITVSNKKSRIYIGVTDYIKAFRGDDGGSQIAGSVSICFRFSC